MKVLLTGDTGMVGSAVKRLSEGSIDITGISSKECDLTDMAATQERLSKNNFDCVVHAAERVGGLQANIDDPLGFMNDNLLISMNMINAAYKNGIKYFINIATSCMYPKNIDRLIVEDDLLTAPLEKTNEGYVIAKIAATKLCCLIDQDSEYSYKTFVPCNMHGIGDHYNIRNSHLVPSVIMKICDAVKNKREAVEIWGDGSPRRECLDVDDFASYIIETVKNKERFNALPSIMNTGFGKDYSVREVYEIVADIVGFDGKFTYNANAPMGMKRKLMDSSLAKKYNWNPKISFRESIEKTAIAYMKETSVN